MILDTNALSALADGDVALERALGDEFELSVPVVVLGEYLFGVRRSRLRTRYEQWLEKHLPLFRLMAIARETAHSYAEIRGELKRSGRPIPTNDLWIAALAREHRLPIVSRDRHFEIVRGVRVVDW